MAPASIPRRLNACLCCGVCIPDLMRKHAPRIAFAAFALFLAAMVVVADLGQGGRFWGFLRKIPLGDKLGHLGLFGVLAVLANLATRAASYRWGGLRIAKGSFWVFAVAFVEECSQAFIPARSFDMVDLTADLLAVILASVVVLRLAPRLWEPPAAEGARAEQAGPTAKDCGALRVAAAGLGFPGAARRATDGGGIPPRMENRENAP